jgi:hypothetical protein
MALYSIVAGATEVTTDVNQYHDLLTGAMTDQAVSLARVLSAGAALLFPQTTTAAPSGSGFGGGLRLSLYDSPANDQAAYGFGIDAATLWYVSAGSNHKWYGASGVALMALSTAGLNLQGYALPNCGAITAASLASSGAVSGTTGTFSGAVSGTSGTFTGAVQSNSHPVVEGTSAVTHAEVYPAQGSTSLGSNATVSFTLTFARAFAGNPAVSASAMNGGAIVPNAQWQPTAISTSSVTFIFMNKDGNPQTMTNFSISALGA